MARWLVAAALALALFGGPALAAPQVGHEGLERLHARIASGEIPGVHGVVVAQGGRTLAEWYFPGPDFNRGRPLGDIAFTADTLHDVRSVTKSVVSLLVGIAVGEGKIKSLDTPVLAWFPEYADLRTPALMKIRLRDMLSMTSGFAWDEDTLPYWNPKNSETAMDLAPDRYRYVLTQAVVAEPGSTFRYSGGDVAIVAEIVKRATGMPLEDYAKAKLFRPLGITHFDWQKDRTGTPFAASGLRLEPRDMAKIGLLMLHRGKVGRRQVVPAPWVKVSTSPHAQVQPDPECGTRYGYFWWLGPGCAGAAKTPWFAGIGNGGQRIWVVPSLDLVIVSTAGLYDKPAQGKTATAIYRGVLDAIPKGAP